MKRIALLALMFVSAFAFAQEFRATLTGRVADPTGAVIPTAQITVTNMDTGVAVSTFSDKTGSYTVPFLLPGKYSIRASASGFGTFVHDNITLLTGAKVEEDLSLKIGSATQEVYVSTDNTLIETSTATMGQVLTSQEIENLPANGRSPLGLAKTEYGVVPKAKNSVTQTRPFDNSPTSDFSIGGGNSQSNELLLNGVPNMVDSSRVSAFSPQLDAVDQIRVDVFESDAAYGDTSGGTVNLTTKAGTNRYHGTLSEFNEFSAINATNAWFAPAGFKQPVTRQNQYGLTLGGPVFIPKVYNGRDKLFFFYSYERFIGTVPNPVTTTVPTAAERNGDFSALLALGPQYQLADPYSAVLTGKSVTRSALAGNIIPPSRIDPVAKAYLKFFPAPNTTGAADGQSNFYSDVPTGQDYNSHSGRLDYSINDNNKIFMEVHRSEYHLTQSNIFNNIATGSRQYTVYQGGLFDFVHTFSSSLTLDSRLSLTRTYNRQTLPSQGFDATTLNFPGYINTNATERVLPMITFSDTSKTVSFATIGAKDTGLSTFDEIQLFSAITKVFGHHTLKIGPDLRQNKLNGLGPNFPSGQFFFDSTFVSGATNGKTIPFGSSFASFLYGLPNAKSNQTNNVASTNNNWYFSGFLQDDWRALPSLTLNIGLRLEHETPIVESNNRAIVSFDPTAQNSAAGPAAAAYAKNPIPELAANAFSATGGFNFASPNHRSEYNTAPLYVSPRIGFAFAPNVFHGKMAIRGGFGLFVNPFNDYNTPQKYGFSTITNVVPTTNNYLTPAAFLSNPFPPALNPIQQPSGAALGVNVALGQDVSFRVPNPKVPYSERWNFDIQQQISRNVMIDIGYIGNHQVHLSQNNLISSIPLLPYLSHSPRQDVAVSANLGSSVANPLFGLYPTNIGIQPTISRSQLLQAFPQFNSVNRGLDPSASATFNELLVRFQKRSSYGLTVNASYEYSRNLSTSQLNQGGPSIYGENSSDYPHHVAIQGSYALPLGHNRAFLSHGRLLDEIVGGFTVSTIYQYLSGTAISWNNFDFANGSAGYKSDFQVDPRNIARAFNTSVFYTGSGQGYQNCLKNLPDCDATDTGQPNKYNYRTAPQYFFRQDPTNDLDASVSKDFHFSERVRVQYRFEAFNALNHTIFGTPNVSPTSSSFGTIKSQANGPRTIQQGLRVVF